MTSIAFHFNMPDKVAYACRLVRKAVSQGSKLVVCADPQGLESLNEALWTFSAHDFLPHCMDSDSLSLRLRSPVILATGSNGLQDLAIHQVLVNLGHAVPDGFDSFERLIELVALTQEDRDAARTRWKYYKGRGFDILRHDLAQKESA